MRVKANASKINKALQQTTAFKGLPALHDKHFLDKWVSVGYRFVNAWSGVLRQNFEFLTRSRYSMRYHGDPSRKNKNSVKGKDLLTCRICGVSVRGYRFKKNPIGLQCLGHFTDRLKEPRKGGSGPAGIRGHKML